MLWHICFQKTFCIIFLIVFLQLKKTEMNATIYSEHCLFLVEMTKNW